LSPRTFTQMVDRGDDPREARPGEGMAGQNPADDRESSTTTDLVSPIDLVNVNYFVVSCFLSSMSWVSSSTTACAMTLLANAARAAGVIRPLGGRIVDVLESPKHAPRNICLRRHIANTEIVECFECWFVRRHWLLQR